MSILLAQSEDHARKLIAALITECRDGVSDREAEALKLAEKFGVEKEPISARFATARKLKAQELAARGGDIAAELSAAIARAQVRGPTPILKMRRIDDPGPRKLIAKPDPKPAQTKIEAPAAKPQVKEEEPKASVAQAPPVLSRACAHGQRTGVCAGQTLGGWRSCDLPPSRRLVGSGMDGSMREPRRKGSAAKFCIISTGQECARRMITSDFGQSLNTPKLSWSV